MEGRLGHDPAMTENGTSIVKAGLSLFAVLVFAMPALAGDFFGNPPLRYGNTSSWHFDARNDDRDFPNNGFFPGNFAANPWPASIGAAGFLESNPYRSPWPYPSQVYFVPAGSARVCVSRHRSSDRASSMKSSVHYSCVRASH
jgi:hypothetical protein